MSDLIRKNLESTELSSLEQLAADAETVMLLLDTSGSMYANVPEAKKRAIDCLRDVVNGILEEGAIPMIAFGGPAGEAVRFVNEVPEPAGGTPLRDAIKLAKTYGATRLVVISDGVPADSMGCLLEADQFGGKIDVVYVGEAGSSGSLFMSTLAERTGGTRKEGNFGNVKLLTSTVIGLLAGDVAPATILQGEGFAPPVETEDADEEDDDEEEEDDDDED